MSDNQVGSVYIRVRPEASGFREETQTKVRRELAGFRAEVPVNPDLNETQMRREHRQAQTYYDRNPLEVDIEAGHDSRLADVEDVLRRMGDQAEETRQSLSGMRRDLSALAQRMSNMEVSVDADDIRDIRRQVSSIEAALGVDTSGASADVEQFKAEYDDQSLSFDLEASPSIPSVVASRQAMSAALQPISVRTRLHMGSAMATMAQLAALGERSRHVDVIPRVPMRAWLAFEAQLAAMSSRRVARMAERTFDRVWRTWSVGGARSLAGLGDMDNIMRGFDETISQLDVKGTQLVTTLTMVGTAANVAGDLVGGLVVSLADLSRVAGLAAAAPTAILAGAALMQTHRAIWQDFSDALEGREDALERLPENAVRAVDAINELSEAVNRSVQDGFWEVMTDEITRFAETVGPVLERGMGRVAEIYGETLSGMLDLAQEWAESGELGAAFSNINRMFEGVGSGLVDIFDAFVTVGMRASGMFPRLGHEFENLGTSINNFFQWASEMGHIERWIAEGVDAFSKLLQIGGSVAGMAQGLTQAFRNAGAWGLSDVVSALERASELMQSDQWQFRMGDIFGGMVEGAELFWSGFAEINSVLYDSHDWLRRILVLTGEIAEAAQFRFADILGNERFQSGGIDLFEGTLDMLDQLEPAADSFANILGNLGSIAGEILREMAPGINTLMGIFSDMLDIIGPAVVELVGPLTQFIENLGHTVRHNVNTIIGPALRGLIDLFMALPPAIQQFLTLGAAMSRWMPAFGQASNRALGKFANGLRRTNQSMLPLTSANRRMTETFRRQANVLPGATGALARANEQYRRTGQLIRGSYQPMSRMRNEMRRYGQSAADAQARANAGFRNVGRNIASAIAPVQRFDDSIRRATDGMERLRKIGDRGVTRFVGTRSGNVSYFQPVHRALDNVEQRSQGVFRGLRSTIDNQLGAAGQTLRGSMVPALGAVKTAARGVAGVFRGMFSLLGGLPGLLLIGTISAISQIRSNAAEAEQRIIGMRNALDSEGESGLRKEIENIDGMGDALGRLSDAGVDTTDVMDRLVEGQGIDSYADDIEQLGTAMKSISWAETEGTAKALKNQLEDIGPAAADMMENLNLEDMDRTEIRELGGDYIDLADDLRGIDDQARKAREGLEAIRESRGQFSDMDVIRDDGFKALNDQLRMTKQEYAKATEEGKAFASMVSSVGDETSTMESRVQGAAQAMRDLNGDYTTFDNMGVEVWDRQQQAVRTLTEAQNENGYIVGDLKEAYDDQGNALGRLATDSESMSEVQKVALQGVSEAHESAMAAGVEAYQRVMDAGGSATEAVEAGRGAYQDATQEIRSMAEEAGYSSEQVDLIAGSMGELADVDDFDFVLTMSGLTDEDIAIVHDALSTLEGQLDNFDEKEWQAYLAANPDQAYGAVNGYEDFVIANFEARQFMTTLGAMDEDAMESVAKATGTMEEYENGYYAAVLTAALEDEEVLEKWPGLKEILDEWDKGGLAEMEIDSPGDDQMETMRNLTEAVENLDDTFRIMIGLDGDNETKQALEEVELDLNYLDGKRVLPSLQLNDEATPGMNSAQSQLGEIDLTSVFPSLGLNDNASGLMDQAQGHLATLDSTNAQPALLLQAQHFFGEEGQARKLIQGFPDGDSILDLIDNASRPAKAAEWVIRGVANGNYDAIISAIQDGGSIASVEWSLNNLARNRTAWVTAKSVRTGGPPGSGLSRVINSLNADGNLYSSVGAKGLKAGFPVKGAFKAFASGGFENHTAQITKPSSPMRVWSEPETGGEAYIPLAASKRSRSREIWRQTGRHLGVTSENSDVITTNEGSTVNLTVNHPQAEPTSRTVQRSMDYLGAGG